MNFTVNNYCFDAQVERQVFDYVEEGGLYLKLYGTAFFDGLINYLIQTRKVNKLLLKTISAGK